MQYTIKNYILHLLITLIFISSCQHQQEKRKTQEQTVRLAMDSSPQLHPLFGTDRRSQLVTNMLFEGLTRLSPAGEPIPAIAQEVTLSSDQKTYTFKLRKAYWSNGDQVCAKDFEYAWKSILTPDAPYVFGELLYPIRNAKEVKEGILPIQNLGVKALDATTLIVELNHPAPFFLKLTANGICFPINHRIDQQTPDWDKKAETFVSNGPFRLAYWEPGEVIEFEKNTIYWDCDHVKLPKIHISIIKDNDTALALYEQGKLDWAGNPFFEIPLENTRRLQKKGLLKTQPIAAVFSYTFDTTTAPLNSKKIRKALSYAIDRQAICSYLLQEMGQPAESLLPAGISFQKDPFHSDEKIELAKQLFQEGLEEMGLTKEQLPPIKIGYALIIGQKAMTQAVQQKWEATFGIQVKIEGFEWGSFMPDYCNRKFPVAGFVRSSIHNDPTFLLNHFYAAYSTLNPSQWEHPKYKAIVDAANQESDLDRRNAFLAEAESFILEEAPVAPIYHAHYRYIKHPRLQGVILRDNGYIDFKWACLKEGCLPL